MQPQDYAASHIVICDDSPTNVAFVEKVLRSFGARDILAFTDPVLALEHLQARPHAVDLLILDLDMPRLSGFDILSALFNSGETGCEQDGSLPVLVITGNDDPKTRQKALALGASDFLSKSIDPTETSLRARNLLRVRKAWKLQADNAKTLEMLVEQRTRELEDSVSALANRLGYAGEMRDSDTGRHVERVGAYSRLLAEKMGMPPDFCRLIEKAAKLHDVGKIGISDTILHKNGKLTPAEMKLMEAHTTNGFILLGGHDSPLIQMSASIACHHHEKWDGTGYPHGLAQTNIPIEARIVSVADVFDALTTRRPYKDPWPADKALELFNQNSGTHFDPDAVAALNEIFPLFVATMQELADAPPKETVSDDESQRVSPFESALISSLNTLRKTAGKKLSNAPYLLCAGGKRKGEKLVIEFPDSASNTSLFADGTFITFLQDSSGPSPSYRVQAEAGMVSLNKAKLPKNVPVTIPDKSTLALGANIWTFNVPPDAQA